MKLKDIINEIINKHPEAQQINIYYYADIKEYLDEFVGVATYHDGFLDTSEDPDGWTLEDEVAWYKEYPMNEEAIDLHVNFGRWS